MIEPKANTIEPEKSSSSTTTQCKDDSYVGEIASLGEYDVLAGRGRIAWNNEGNKTFREIVSRNVNRYNAAPTIKDKTAIIGSIVNYMLHDLGARFVKESEDGSYYEILDKKEAHNKVGHAIRDLSKKIQRKQNAKAKALSVPSHEETSMSNINTIHQRLEVPAKQWHRRQSDVKLLDEESLTRLVESFSYSPSSIKRRSCTRRREIMLTRASLVMSQDDLEPFPV